MKAFRQPGQSLQRVRVGLTGLAIVLVLIGLASVVFRSVSRERPGTAPGLARAETLANMAAGNTADPSGEPLAELGVAPAGQENAAASAPH